MEEPHIDVIVVGAGISGIDAAYHLTQRCPDRSFVVLEGRNDLGGTWDLFRYPGIRSDSDMHTLGYGFKPWTHDRVIADGASIKAYLEDTVDEFDLRQYLRFDTHVDRAEWSTRDARWTLTTTDTSTGEQRIRTCSFLFMCAGYYSYRGGYRPGFPGEERFTGPIVHPQDWPDELDLTDRRVVVIGSGATAMTLVPAIAEDARHVTMLQRSPTYVVSLPSRDPIARVLRRVLPDRLAGRLTRAKNIALGQWFYRLTRTRPEKARRRLLEMVRSELGDEMVEQHFTPSYDPWDQRLCVIPDGDLYRALQSGAASVATDTIDTFTETGIDLSSGTHLDADVIVTATGLQLVTLGEVDIRVDGEPVDFADTFTYKGIAYSDVPNLASTFGYVNASWTLRADMVCEWVCRLLNHMRATRADIVVPRLRPGDRNMPQRPWIEDFSAGYVRRMAPLLPKQGDRDPWVVNQSYAADRRLLAEAPIADDVLEFGRTPVTSEAAPTSCRDGSPATAHRSGRGRLS